MKENFEASSTAKYFILKNYIFLFKLKTSITHFLSKHSFAYSIFC